MKRHLHFHKLAFLGVLLLVIYNCFHGQSRTAPSTVSIGNILHTESDLTKRYEACMHAERAVGDLLCCTNGNAIWRFVNKGGTITVVGVDFVERGQRERLDVPSSICGLQVTRIGDGAFHDCNSIVEIRLPDSVKTIGDFAFVQCKSLQMFKTPPALERIGDCLFVGCSDMTTIQISERISSIGAFAFLGCKSIRSLEVDQNNNAFMSKDGVLLTRDGRELISYPCGREETHYAIPQTVRAIRKGAFVDCAHLEHVFIPEGVAVIDDWNFFACRRLKNIFMSRNDRIMLGRNIPLKFIRNAR